MPERIYLDNASTTPVDPRVVEAMMPFLGLKFGNASSIHLFGQEARAGVDRARAQVAQLISSSPGEVLFTSGGTESNNLALKGFAEANLEHGRHLVTTNIEHPAVSEVCDHLSSIGFEITVVPCGADGVVDSGDVLSAVREDTILVSMMLVNNELGTLQPVAAVGDALKSLKHDGRKIALHTDAVQALGKMNFSVDELGCDLLSMSSHKVYAPKGTGALFVRKGTRLKKQSFGGGQEKKLRGGTENVPGIVAFGEACELASANLAQETRRLRSMTETFERSAAEMVPEARFNGNRDLRVPNISNISFMGFEGEAVLINLDLRGIAVSTGSACSSGSIEPSPIIRALGQGEELARSAVRFSFGRFNSEEEIPRVVAALVETLDNIRGTVKP